jgi:hypothetical protein
MKRIVLQGLRNWFSRPILDNGGVLSVGYGYQNLIMADHYNSPGSPYWGLKAFIVLSLGEDHPFWRAEEAPLPEQPAITADKIPGFIISRNSEDAQLLCAGGMPSFEMNHSAQKYSKFAYSAQFGFCAAHGACTLEQAGGDSMLLLSDADSLPETETGYWRERRAVEEKRIGTNWVSSVWRPWPDVRIRTVLVCLGSWHLRIHRIESNRQLKTAEGGFAVRRYNEFDEALPVSNTATGAAEALAAFPWGASRIAAMEPERKRSGTLIITMPNLTVLEPCCVIPTLRGTVGKGITILATAVRAGDQDAVNKAPLPHVMLRDDSAEIFNGDEKQVIRLT